MFCQNCGISGVDGMKFCPQCGAKLVVLEKAPLQEQPVEQPAEQPIEQITEEAHSEVFEFPYQEMPLEAETAGYEEELGEIAPAKGEGLAIAGLVLGIISIFCCGMVTSVPGIILSIIALAKGYKGGMAVMGLICSAIGLLWGFIGLGITLLNIFLPFIG